MSQANNPPFRDPPSGRSAGQSRRSKSRRASTTHKQTVGSSQGYQSRALTVGYRTVSDLHRKHRAEWAIGGCDHGPFS